MEFNELQSSEEELQLSSLPEEIQEQFWDCINNVPYIKNLVAKDRPRAKDLPRDEKGRIIVDLAKPHILEDMDYFRQTAIYFQEHGQFTNLTYSADPHSAFYKWAMQEIDRIYDGMVRESDGEWIPGNMYFFLNYCRVEVTKPDPTGKSKKAVKIPDFPNTWEGIYYRYHYIDQAINGGMYSPPNHYGGQNGCEISSRGKAKSVTMAAIMTKYFKVGETKEANERIKCVATASDKTYLTSDGLLNKFDMFSNFLNQYGFFPKMTTKASLNDMHWISGYKEVDGTIKGTQNEVIGVSSGENDDKIRGKRMQFFIVEEFGNFKNILDVWEVVQPCVQDGDLSFGCAYFIGTSNNDESDFLGAQQIVFNPKGYNMYAIPNVFDKEGQGKKIITFFFPAYINREGCYDHNGNSDVTKALIQILTYRWEKKHNTTDLNAVTKAISEYPITPQEALLRARNNLFPVADLNNRVNQIDADPNILNSVMVGTLVMDNNGKPKFEPTNDIPIRDFPLKDNKAEGALEIYEMPNTMIDETSGVEIVPNDRYIIGFDNYENDVSNTLSLGSIIVLDLWTDRIVAEYTGRPARVDDLNEMARRMCLFYNAKVMYENNKKNTFAYFQKMNCIYLLADTPSFINRPQDMSSKFTGINNTMKGINCTTPIINLGLTLIKEWLTLPVKVMETIDGEQVETTVFNLYTIKNRALLRELICFNPEINVDRIRSLTQLLIYRADKRVLLGDDIQSKAHKPKPKQDDYFDKAYSKYQKNRIKFKQS